MKINLNKNLLQLIIKNYYINEIIKLFQLITTKKITKIKKRKKKLIMFKKRIMIKII